jgi:hypothetical protein
MKSSRNNRRTRTRPQTEERDYLLIVLLAIFNLVSGYTTIKGAEQVLGNFSLAFFLGGFIQLGLFLMLSDFVMRRAHLRKWMAVIVFTFISVYTSFFTYYTTLASETNKQLAYNKAVQAHNRLIEDVYTPIKERLSQLQEDSKITRRKAQEEASIGLTTGITGRGPVAQSFEEQALEKEEEAKQFASTVEELEPKFEYDLKGLEPKDILERDGQALAAVPEKFRNHYQDLKRTSYINPEDEISILTPYLKVKSPDPNQRRPGIISFLLALLVDGMSIMLGTAITIKHNSRSPFLVAGEFIADLINDIKSAINMIINASGKPGNILHQSKLAEIKSELTETLQRITTLLENRGGKGTEFLEYFDKSIRENEAHVIDINSLQENKKYQQGFRLLIDKLKDPKIGWVRLSNNRYVVPKEYYHYLKDWLNSELLQIGVEEVKNNYDDELFRPKKFQVRRTSDTDQD